MYTCKTSVTTPTGEFTYFKDEVTYHQAKVECVKKNQILAPVTNKRDYDALLSITGSKDAPCEFYQQEIKYHIGLDINIDPNGFETRLFTNNKNWNDTEHGTLYVEHGFKPNRKKNMNFAVIAPYVKEEIDKVMFVVKDSIAKKRRFICLKPSSQSTSVCNVNYFPLIISVTVVIIVASVWIILSIKKK